jgi:Integrase core domain
VTHYILFFMDIANRAVKIAGITPHPDSRWMTQIARNLTDLNDGFLRGQRYLILDRDIKYSDAFRSVLVREGIHVIRLPPRSPNLNAFAERFVRSIKEECLSRMIFVGPASLQHAVRQFMAHYHSERNHQGLENRLPQPASVTALPHHPVQRRQRLGGIAQLLPSGRSLTNVDCFFGQFGQPPSAWPPERRFHLSRPEGPRERGRRIFLPSHQVASCHVLWRRVDRRIRVRPPQCFGPNRSRCR